MAGALTKGLGTALVLVVVAFCVTTIPGARSGRGFDPLLDGWLQVGGYLLAAAYACSHPLLHSRERLLWALVAAALCLRAAGFALFVTLVRTEVPQPYPSIADAAWLLSTVVLLVGLALRLRARSSGMSTVVVLDALLGAVTTACIAIAALYEPLDKLSASSDATATATNLAYPVTDVAVLTLIAGLLAATRYRPPPSKGLLAIGLATFAIVDCVFLYQVSAGTYRPGTWLAALSLSGTAVAAAAGAVRDTEDRSQVRDVPGLWLPAVFSLPLLAVLAAPTWSDSRVPPVAVVLAVAGLLLAIVRALLTATLERRVAERRLTDAAIDTWRFATLVESSADLVAISDFNGDITYLNPAGRLLLNLEAPRPHRKLNWADFAAGSQLDWATIQHRLRAGERLNLELELQPAGDAAQVPVGASFFTMRHPSRGASLGVATVMRDVAQRVEAERSLRELSEQRRELLARLIVAQEEERGRIASDVHDDSLQVLAALDLRLRSLSGRLTTHQPALLRDLDATVVELRAAMQRLRHLVFDLDSPVAHMGLDAVLTTAAQHIFEGCEVRVEVVAPDTDALSEELRITTYRIVREALVNVRKHARASRVLIELSLAPGELQILVRDDGRGLEETALEAKAGHRGVSGMRDRASAAGGTLQLGQATGSGAELRVVLPV